MSGCDRLRLRSSSSNLSLVLEHTASSLVLVKAICQHALVNECRSSGYIAILHIYTDTRFVCLDKRPSIETRVVGKDANIRFCLAVSWLALLQVRYYYRDKQLPPGTACHIKNDLVFLGARRCIYTKYSFSHSVRRIQPIERTTLTHIKPQRWLRLLLYVTDHQDLCFGAIVNSEVRLHCIYIYAMSFQHHDICRSAQTNTIPRRKGV